MTRELTNEENAMLVDADRLHAEGGKGIELDDRLVDGRDWSGLSLTEPVFRNLEMRNVRMRSSRITGGRMIGLDTEGLDLTSAVFTDVAFEDCVFGRSDWSAARFLRCSFKSCRLTEVEGRRAQLLHCSFDACEDRSSQLEDAVLDTLTIRDSLLEQTSLSRCRLRDVTSADSRWNGVIMGLCEVERLGFSGGSLADCGFNEGSWRDVTLEAVTVDSISFGAPTVEGIELTGCRGVDGLALIGARIADCTLSDCSGVTDWTAFETTIQRLRITNSRLEYLDWELCAIDGPSTIERTVFAGANFTESRWTDASFEGCVFEDFLVLAQTRLERVRLSGPRWGRGLELMDEGVTYIESDRFGAG